MKIQATIRCHHTAGGVIIIRRPKVCGRKEPLLTVGRNINEYNHYGRQYGGSSKY
jgi:hypothetical protein